jgi:ribosomal protein S18 acetylase RimI-like enzyme
MADTWAHLTKAMPGAWTRADSGARAAVTGIGLPSMNGVIAISEEVSPEIVGELLDEVAATGLPYSLQVRPGSAERLAGVATARSLAAKELVPLMVLDGPPSHDALDVPAELSIRELQAGESQLHAEVMADAFEAPLEQMMELITPPVLEARGVRCYLGEVDGRPVATGLGVTLGEYVAIFNIATPAPFRGRGYGAAMTAQAIADGIDAGAEWSWLQSTAAGLSVYERLGFHTAEEWSVWLSVGEGSI